MRWKLPEDGDIKLIKKFLLFPRIHEHTIYWLETVTLKFRYSTRRDKFHHSGWQLVDIIEKYNGE